MTKATVKKSLYGCTTTWVEDGVKHEAEVENGAVAKISMVSTSTEAGPDGALVGRVQRVFVAPSEVPAALDRLAAKAGKEIRRELKKATANARRK